MRGLLLSLLGLLLFSAGARAQEPEFNGKKASEWIGILKDGKREVKVRRTALIALEVIGPVKGVVEAIRDTFEEDASAEVRREAGLALGRINPDYAKIAVLALGEALNPKKEKAGPVREAAAIALAGELSKFASGQVTALGKALADEYPPVHVAAAEALKSLGQNSLDAFDGMVGLVINPKADPVARRYLIQATSRLKDLSPKRQGQLIEGLTQIVKDSGAQKEVRETALEALGFMKTDKAVPALVAGLTSTEVELRRMAIRALGPLQEKAKDAYDVLVRVVVGTKEEKADKDIIVRGQAILLLGVLGKEKAEAIPVLVQAAEKDESLDNRLFAIRVLGDLGPAAMEALKSLENLAVNDVRAPVRTAARLAISKIKGS